MLTLKYCTEFICGQHYVHHHLTALFALFVVGFHSNAQFPVRIYSLLIIETHSNRTNPIFTIIILLYRYAKSVNSPHA